MLGKKGYVVVVVAAAWLSQGEIRAFLEDSSCGSIFLSFVSNFLVSFSTKFGRLGWHNLGTFSDLDLNS